ncbi:energy transducer TonB [Thioclava sp. BHET1]|nr:energy transducer TonB [Thioclava sp. BHET1]
MARSDRHVKRGDRNRAASAGSARQVAAGSGGGQNAGDGGSAAAASAEAGRLSDLRMGWGAVIRARIERDKSYPDAADGAAGRVMVRLTVGRDGGLRALSLIRSSGNSALDQAALRAVRSASPYPAAPDGLSQANYSFNLPMTFGS